LISTNNSKIVNEIQLNTTNRREIIKTDNLDRNEFCDILNYLYESQVFLIDSTLLKNIHYNDHSKNSNLTGVKAIHQFEIVEDLFVKTFHDEIHTNVIFAFGIYAYLFDSLNEVKRIHFLLEV